MRRQNRTFYIRFGDAKSYRTYACTSNRVRKGFGKSYYGVWSPRGESHSENAVPTAGMHCVGAQKVCVKVRYSVMKTIKLNFCNRLQLTSDLV
jgi:hypothetical protein